MNTASRRHVDKTFMKENKRLGRLCLDISSFGVNSGCFDVNAPPLIYDMLMIMVS